MQVFEQFLAGDTLEECYAAVASVADRWLDLLDTQVRKLYSHRQISSILCSCCECASIRSCACILIREGSAEHSNCRAGWMWQGAGSAASHEDFIAWMVQAVAAPLAHAFLKAQASCLMPAGHRCYG